MNVIVVNFGQKSALRIGLVLDFLYVKHKIASPDEVINPNKISHVILSGGPNHVYEANSYKMPKWIFNFKGPVLGICYGMQVIAHTLDETSVIKMNEHQKGPTEVDEIIDGEMRRTIRWYNRIDQVIKIPSTFKITGVSDGTIAKIDNKLWCGVQYHPETEGYVDLNLFLRFLKGRPI